MANAFMSGSESENENTGPQARGPIPAGYRSDKPIAEIEEDFYWRGFQDAFKQVTARSNTNYEEMAKKYL